MMKDLSTPTPFLKGYRVYPGQTALERELLSPEEYARLGSPVRVCLLYALGSWVFGDRVVSEATFVVDARCSADLVGRFEAGGGGQHPGLTCGSGYWDTLVDLVLPDGCPHLLLAGWLDGWRPGWEIPPA